MISLNDAQLEKNKLRKSLDDFEYLLSENENIGETELLNFFKSRPQLILLMGRVVGVDAPRKYNDELPIIGKFRSDFVVSDKAQKNFSFIEFEDAKEDSIFKKTLNKKTSVYPWSSRFEHGYSQVIDWYLHLSLNNQTPNMKAEFGEYEISYSGALIIGRRSSLDKADCSERFEQRVRKSLIDSKHIACYTFDDLYEAMEDQFSILSSF